MNFNHLDDNLPKGSSNKNLEKISRVKFEQLLDPEKFQARSETEADVGIDFIVELKHNNHHTNFRFAVQLKATASLNPTSDGSYAFQVDVSNVNYLFNFAGLSFYVLYLQKEDTFLYINAHTVFTYLSETYPDDKWPHTVSLKFKDVLDQQALNDLYELIFSRSKTIRHVNHLLNVNLQSDELSNRVVIENNEQVMSAADAVKTLEKTGMKLMNLYQYDEILRLKNLVNINQVESGLFHAVCALAHYHRSEMHQALVSFKLARKYSKDLLPHMLDMIFYHVEAAKFVLGINSKEEYDAAVDKIINSKYIGLYLSIEKSYFDLFDNEGLTETKVEGFYKRMQEIAENAEADENIIIHARAQILNMESEVLNNSLIKNISAMKSMPWAVPELQEQMKYWEETASLFAPRAESLRQIALTGQHYFAYNIITLTIVKANYANLYTQLYMLNFDEEKLAVNIKLTEEMVDNMLENCSVLDGVIEVYSKLNSNENIIVALSLKYELLDFIGYKEQAAQVADQMETLIDTYDLKDLQRRFKYLVNGGTKHEQFLQFLIQTFKRTQEAKRERDEIIEALRQLDKDEPTGKPLKDSYQLNFFPLGNFSFPKNRFDFVMDLLEVLPPIREQIHNMAEFVRPIVNVYQRPVTAEGAGNGLQSATLEGYRNLLRVRTALSENKFTRLAQ